MHIRLGTDEDIPTLMPMLVEFHKTIGLNYPPLSPQKTVAMMFQLVKDGLLLLAETHDKKIAGVLGLNKGQYVFSDHSFIGDVVYYVSETYRASSAGFQLMRAAQTIAEGMNVPLVMHIFSGVDAKRKDAFYERTGMTYLGGIFSRGM